MEAAINSREQQGNNDTRKKTNGAQIHVKKGEPIIYDLQLVAIWHKLKDDASMQSLERTSLWRQERSPSRVTEYYEISWNEHANR